MIEPKLKAFVWKCNNCGNWIRIVPPDLVMEVKKYWCAYDGFEMQLHIVPTSVEVKDVK